MSILSEGLQNVSFLFSGPTEGRILSPVGFLSAWGEVVRAQQSLTGFVPSHHPNRPSTKLVVQEVFQDPEVGTRFAVWSPRENKIKLNGAYADRFVQAANVSPIVGELAEALGMATLSFQQRDPNELFPQALGWSQLSVGLARAIGVHALSTSNEEVSSLWIRNSAMPYDAYLYREMTRCYRKYRLGLRGDDYFVNGATEGDPDLAYGFFLELFTAFGDWSHAVALMERAKLLIKDDETFTRSVPRQFDDLVTALSDILGADLASLLVTWGFSRLNALEKVPEGRPRLGTAQPMVMSSRFKASIDPLVVERENRTAALPGIVLGGSDTFGIGQTDSPPVVLISATPEDGVSYKNRKALLLDGFESNRLPREITLLHNLGEVGSPVQTVLVPFNATAWEHRSRIQIEPGAGQSLVAARVLNLGEPARVLKRQVSRWNDQGEEITETVDVEVETFAIVAMEGVGYYTYVDQFGSKIAQVITVETYPFERFKDPDTGVITENPGGHAQVLRSMVTTMGLDSSLYRSFVSVTQIQSAGGETRFAEVETVPPTLDPAFAPLRERQLSDGRPKADILKELVNPVLMEKMGLATRRLGANLAEAAAMTIHTTGYHTNEQVIEVLRATMPATPIQVVNLPIEFVAAVQRLNDLTALPGDTPAEKELAKVAELQALFDGLPANVKKALKDAELNKPLVIPQLDGSVVPLPTLSPGNPTTPFSIKDSLVKAARGLALDKPLPPQDLSSVRRVGQLQDRVNQARAHSQPNYLKDLIGGALGAQAVRTNNDPNNPLTYLDGTFLANVMRVMRDQNGKFTGTLDLSTNPRAVSSVVASLVGTAAAAMGLERMSPGAASTLMKSVEDNLFAMAVADRPPSHVFTEIGKDLAKNLAGTFLQNDPQGQAIAGRMIDFLGDLMKDANDGRVMVHDLRDAFKVQLNGYTVDLRSPRKNVGQSTAVDYIDVALGLESAMYDSASANDPILKQILQTQYGDFIETQGSGASLVIGKDSPGSDIGYFQKLFQNNLPAILTQGIGKERELKLRQHLSYMKQDRAAAASLQNVRAALVQEVVAYQALGSSPDEAKRIYDSVRVFSFAGKTVAPKDPSAVVAEYDATGLSEVSSKKLLGWLSDLQGPGAKAGMGFTLSTVYNRQTKSLRVLPQVTATAVNPRELVFSAIAGSSTDKEKLRKFQERIAAENKARLTNENLRMNAVARIQEEGMGRAQSYTFEIMPAVKSVADTKGMQAPGADRGVQLRSSLNIAKLNVPGYKPVYQVMGINEEFVEFVGSFLGFYDSTDPDRRDHSRLEDIPSLGDFEAGRQLFGTGRQYFRAYQESQLVRHLQMKGRRLELTIESYSGAASKENTPTEQGIRIKVKGYIQAFERFAQRDDRVWYRIGFRVTDHRMLTGQDYTNTVGSAFAIDPNYAFSNQVRVASGEIFLTATDLNDDPIKVGAAESVALPNVSDAELEALLGELQQQDKAMLEELKTIKTSGKAPTPGYQEYGGAVKDIQQRGGTPPYVDRASQGILPDRLNQTYFDPATSPVVGNLEGGLDLDPSQPLFHDRNGV